VAEGCTIYSSRSRLSVRILLDPPSLTLLLRHWARCLGFLELFGF